ncbi:hypothetical protein RDI58_000870 [Solanum bulbocastanum]|uniref:Uncharacterized protein n=1 Tax=Solanum bulbocastanum TaxID=147425 RepID=A0AAN8YPL4_SOLBU
MLQACHNAYDLIVAVRSILVSFTKLPLYMIWIIPLASILISFPKSLVAQNMAMMSPNASLIQFGRVISVTKQIGLAMLLYEMTSTQHT